MHELGHSFGSEHDPRAKGACSPGGDKGNYLMYPGPLGHTNIQRRFSACSIKQIQTAINETEGLCMATLEELNQLTADAKPLDPEDLSQHDADNEPLNAETDAGGLTNETVETGVTESPVQQQTCSTQKIKNILKKLKTYIKDLRDYQEEDNASLRSFLQKYLRKLIKVEDEILGKESEPSAESLLKVAKLYREEQVAVEGELSTFINRKIKNLNRALATCTK